MSSTVLVRTKLTPDEWADIRKIAIDRRVKVSQLVADVLREHLLRKG
jgi:predicted DNA-binding ribbon-helix-helix protein